MTQKNMNIKSGVNPKKNYEVVFENGVLEVFYEDKLLGHYEGVQLKLNTVETCYMRDIQLNEYQLCGDMNIKAVKKVVKENIGIADLYEANVLHNNGNVECKIKKVAYLHLSNDGSIRLIGGNGTKMECSGIPSYNVYDTIVVMAAALHLSSKMSLL